MSSGPHKRPAADEPRRLTDGGAETPDEQAMAALLARAPAATADHLAVARVWRQVVAPERRRASRPVYGWAPGVALVLLLITVAFPLLRRGPAGVELAASSGGVFSTRLAETWHAGQPGDAFLEASRLRTDVTGRALLRLRGVSSVLLTEDSDVGFERLSHGTFLRLSHGVLTARVSKRAPDEPFVVQTDRYSVKVVGTLFTVEQGPGDRTVVSVREGTVEVSDGAGHVERVVAGTRWTSDAASARGNDHTPDEVRRLLEDTLQAAPASQIARDFATLARPTAALPVTGSAGANSDRPGTTTNDSAASPQPPSGAPSPLSHGAAVASDASAHAAPPALREPEAAAPSEIPATPPPVLGLADAAAPAPMASAAAAIDDPYAHGLALEGHGDLEGAARELARAADHDPLHGDLALYSLGRLAQQQLHDPARALATFRRYRERYPRGALIPEVDFEILKLEVEEREPAAALAETTRFLSNHPGSERAQTVHLLRGNLLRDAGRCGEALGDYAAIRDVSPADDALYSTAYCQRKLGDRATAAATLTTYLQRFPAGAHRADALRAIESGNETEK